tara:strand:- start:2779 stop:3615 length:837 start_codon:yes stop_codon:yes gene_type:complete
MDNLSHWNDWAEKYGSGLRATTKTNSIKRIEIFEISKAISKILKISKKEEEGLSILEVGCGNGYNTIAIKEMFGKAEVHGIDFSPEMINNAKILLSQTTIKNSNSIGFFIGDAKELNNQELLLDKYDIIFTDRCLINLLGDGDLKKALKSIFSKLKKGGACIFIENFVNSRNKQDALRKIVGLESREIPKFNKFLYEESFLDLIKNYADVIEFKCISSLHDLVLYLLTPALNNGKVDYESPIVEKVTDLIINSDKKFNYKMNISPDIGQNSICICVYN